VSEPYDESLASPYDEPPEEPSGDSSNEPTGEAPAEPPEPPPDDAFAPLRAALDRAAEGVTRPDGDAEDEARRVVGSGTAAAGRLGRLAEWGIRLSGLQGAYPPGPVQRVSLLVLGADPSPDHPVHRLSVAEAVTSRPVSLAADATGADAVTAGAAAVDDAVDSGCDLILLSAVVEPELSGTLVALLLRLSATEVVGDSAHLDDEHWAATVAGIRDRTHAIRSREDDPVAVLDGVGSPVVAALVGALLRAAARRTPVLIDGAADAAAALAASRHAILASWWWFAATTSVDPATTRAVEALGLEPLLQLDAHLDAGAAALVALPVLRAVESVLPPG
jgi:NaMN:DMB phosphoribosyltransferase